MTDCKYKKYNCIFTGGSVRGLSYVGVIKAIEELNIEFDIYVGSSIGSIIDNDATQTYCNNEKFDIIQIDVPNVSFIDFILSKEQKNVFMK